VLTLLEKGLIEASDAVLRLSNLGYSNADRMVLLGEAQQRILDNEAKALRATAEIDSRAAKETAKAIQESEKQTARLQKQLCSYYTIPKLKKWYADYVIGENTLTERMRQCGYPDDVIQNTLLEAMIDRETLSKKRAAAAQSVTTEFNGAAS
jgi:hypothetical protein